MEGEQVSGARAVDLTAAERRLLDLVDTPLVLSAIGEDGRPRAVFANRANLENGSAARMSIVGTTVAERHPPPGGDVALRRQMEAAASGEEVAYEARLSTARGLRRIQTTCTPIKDASGRVVGLFETLLDVGRIAERRDQTAIMSDVVIRDMEQFVVLAAHDLKVPLRRMKLFAEVLRRDFTDLGDGKAELLEQLESVATGAMDVFASVLDYAQATGSGADLVDVSFPEMIDDIVAIVDPGDAHRVVAPSDRLVCEAIGLKTVLRNLVSNSFKHGGVTPTTVTISVDAAVAEDMLEIVVADDGRGFENPAGVFDPASLPLRGGEGGGFGLMAVRRLVRARGGDIQARPPKSGVGAEIAFTYPGSLNDEGAVERA